MLGVALCTTSAQAETTYYVTGGDLTEWLFWNLNTGVDYPAGKPAVTFDNGEPANQGGVVNVNDYTYQVGSRRPIYGLPLPAPWLRAGAFAYSTDPADINPVPVSFNTAYTGTIVTDDAGNVIGGIFSAAGTMAYHLDIFTQSAMMAELIDMSWDLSTGLASGFTNCHLGDLGAVLSPDFCNAALLDEYNLVSGQEGAAGAVRPAVTFDPVTGTLAFFAEGFDSQPPPNSFKIDNAFTFLVTTTLVSPSAADLQVNQSVSGDPVAPGDALTYDILVTNAGPAAATGIVLTDTLPAGSAFSSASAGCTEAAGMVTCNLNDLAVNESTSRQIALTAPAVEGTMTNNVGVAGDQDDPDTGNNGSALTSQVSTVPVLRADLSVSQTVLAEPADPADPAAQGVTLTYDILVTNHGPDGATGVVLTDTLPAGSVLSSVSAGCTESAGVVTCALDDLSVDESTSRQIILTAPGGQGTMTNEVSVTCDQVDPRISNDSSALALTSAGIEVGSSGLGWTDIVLLGLLCVIRNYHRSRAWARSRSRSIALIACILPLLAPSPASAADLVWYAGVAGGRADADFSASDVIDTLGTSGAAITNVSVDNSDTGWKVFQGGIFGRYLGPELAYVDLGDVGASFDATGTGAPPLPGNAVLQSVSAVSLSAVARYPVSRWFNVFGKIGAFYWDSNANVHISGVAVSSSVADDDGMDLTWGGGVEFYLLKLPVGRLGIRAEWERYTPDGTDVDFMSGALILRFGQ